MSSKLSLLCFRFGFVRNDSQADCYVKLFFRSRVVREISGFDEKKEVTTITTRQAVYQVRESIIIRKLEPWSFQQQ